VGRVLDARCDVTVQQLAAARAAPRLRAPSLWPGAPGRIVLPVAGDDDVAKAVVLKLVEELGFDGDGLSGVALA
jgi:predicted dinucleotide-binding enzyme